MIDDMLRLLARLVLIVVILNQAEGRAETPAWLSRSPITPIPAPPQADPRKIALGERLFRDPVISGDRSISCESCHALEGNGADGRTMPSGKQEGWVMFNTPTVFNASLNPRLNWRGEFDSLEQQTIGTLANPHVMNIERAEVVRRLEADPSYREQFANIYGGKPTIDQVADVLSTFERQLVTPGSPFDRYLQGDDKAISAEAEQGYALFQQYGCIACHQGRNVGGNLYQKFGIFGDPFSDGERQPGDLGRYDITKRESDRGVFRVPSLRNVADTPPYFHDGSAQTLEDAIETMANVQLGRNLHPNDVNLIAAFLRTLSARPEIGTSGSGAVKAENSAPP
jgi:cytochrome c peroxidase